MNDLNEFYKKKMKLYMDARDSLERAMTALELVKKLEDKAPGRDADEIVEIENTLTDLENSHAFAYAMVDALEPYIDP